MPNIKQNINRLPLVSIVVPTYNRAYCLGSTLDSALTQTYQNIEILVVDDGSQDDTPDVIRDRYGAEPRVRYFRQPNAGVSAARNRAMEMAQGDFIAFLDSDDVWEPWKLSVQLACFAHCPDVGMVWTDMKAVDSAGASLSDRYLRRMYSAYRHYPSHSLFTESFPLTDILAAEVFNAKVFIDNCDVFPTAEWQALRFHTGVIFPQMVRGSFVHTSAVLLRRAWALQVGAFDTQFHNIGEDYDFHLRTTKLGKVGYVDVSSIRYRVKAEDQLTQPSHHLGAARNFLIVVERELNDPVTRHQLGEAICAETLAEAYTWIGHEMLTKGDTQSAKRYFQKSLEFAPGGPEVRRQLLVASLPEGVYSAVRSLYRRVRYRS